ncbi:hypothetical protein BC941DRAFT_423588 [Chlamydoabsidia padenii]|nr:hypothetical protein BC941DRAFT_423588 [Chlamydoabsidia padenii]
MPVPTQYNCIRRMSTITVPKQDIHFDVYDFQQCKPQNNIDTTLESRQLEADYCRDFSCCGLVLNDLHDLLQHYEESHVQGEEDDLYSQDDTNDAEHDGWLVNGSTMTRPKATCLFDMDDGQMDSIYDSEPLSPHTSGFSSDGEYSMPPTPSYSCLMNGGEYDNLTDDDEDDTGSIRMCGKKRTFQQASTNNAMDLLTLSAAKKLALAAPESFNYLTDEEFLAHAGVLLASANTSYLYADKPYKCMVQGCDKAYKNPNGLKYHKEHGHCNDNEMNETPKPYQCTIGDCGKRYKNLNGLKYHVEHSHMAALNHTLATFGVLQTPPPSAISSPLLDSLDSPFF